MNNVHCPSMSCQRSGSADFQQNRQSDVNYQLEQPKMRLFVTTASYWSLKNGATSNSAAFPVFSRECMTEDERFPKDEKTDHINPLERTRGSLGQKSNLAAHEGQESSALEYDLIIDDCPREARARF